MGQIRKTTGTVVPVVNMLKYALRWSPCMMAPDGPWWSLTGLPDIVLEGSWWSLMVPDVSWCKIKVLPLLFRWYTVWQPVTLLWIIVESNQSSTLVWELELLVWLGHNRCSGFLWSSIWCAWSAISRFRCWAMNDFDFLSKSLVGASGYVIQHGSEIWNETPCEIWTENEKQKEIWAWNKEWDGIWTDDETSDEIWTGNVKQDEIWTDERQDVIWTGNETHNDIECRNSADTVSRSWSESESESETRTRTDHVRWSISLDDYGFVWHMKQLCVLRLLTWNFQRRVLALVSWWQKLTLQLWKQS